MSEESIPPPTLPSESPPVLTIAQVTAAHVRKVLELYNWNHSRAATALGINRRTLYRMGERWQITRAAPTEDAT